MPITLITGANKGLGYQTAKQLIERGHTVFATARDHGRGTTAAAQLGARFLHLDVRDESSIKAAADEIHRIEGRLDVLINNAGIAGSWATPEDVSAADAREAYETNVFGPINVIRTFLPLLRQSGAPVVVNVSSGLGSFGVVTDSGRMESRYPSIIYASSKTALSMVTVQYAKAFPEIRINVVDPGFTAPDLNGNTGTKTVE